MLVFEIVHENTLHRVEMPAAFFKSCSNCPMPYEAASLPITCAKHAPRGDVSVWCGKAGRRRSEVT